MNTHHEHDDDRIVVRLVDALLKNALYAHASDIHLEPSRDILRIRYRIDGMLYDQDPVEITLAAQIISRLKVLARMNIAQKRIPQDGKLIFMCEGREIDVRVSTFPALYGEHVVLRLLDRTHQMITLDALGFSSAMLASFKQLLTYQHGLLLVTGPTGSGKTTTLYAALSELNNVDTHIITLEDPVEYSVEGITQGHINPDAGFTFESGVRAMLRQDPDILLVGEIRDRQTARIAIEAALTGHLVLSTLHTNDAPSAIVRLMDMGVEPFLINASLIGVLAQRLVRKLCNECKIPHQPTADELLFLQQCNAQEHISIFEAHGCDVCNNTGYKGRIGVFELLTITNAMRSLIVTHPVIEDVYTQAQRDGTQPMVHDACHKVCNGILSVSEALSVVS